MTKTPGTAYLEDVLFEFRKSRRLAEKAMDQVSDLEFFAVMDAETNSIAVIVKHLAGNMRSRWTDFLTSDGEKPDRNRDTEFVIEPADTRDSLVARWAAGWQLVTDAITPLGDEDLLRMVVIRTEPHTVIQAINRQLTHYAYHAGQIVLVARHFRAAEWKTLSIARGQSEAFNTEMLKKKLPPR